MFSLFCFFLAAVHELKLFVYATRARRRTRVFGCKRHVELTHKCCNPTSEQMKKVLQKRILEYVTLIFSSNGHHPPFTSNDLTKHESGKSSMLGEACGCFNDISKGLTTVACYAYWLATHLFLKQ